MRAFWWFKENSIAGMARPGFNHIRWFELPFDEAVVMGWIGQHSSGEINLDSFNQHLKIYVPKILRFYKLDEKIFFDKMKNFENSENLYQIFKNLSKRTHFISEVTIANRTVYFQVNKERMNFEINFFKKNGIRRVISLTEKHHDKDLLQDHFDLHHISIEDLGVPQIEQVYQLVEIIESARANNERIAIHCLAGIGRTSTMLIAAHVLMGAELGDMLSRIKTQNPSYVLTDSQMNFLTTAIEK